MRDFSNVFCVNYTFLAWKIALFYDFFCWNQIKQEFLVKKSLNGGFFIEQYRSSIGIWIDVLIWLGSGAALLGDWRWAIGDRTGKHLQSTKSVFLLPKST